MKKQQKIRYAVVGLGYISQIAVLPAFKNAKNSELTALVSGNPGKLKKLGKMYKVKHLVNYEGYEALLHSGLIDAVFIALPNDQHRVFAEKAAEAKIHVLCEKPMAVSSADCSAMIESAEKNHVKLMVAYRLHFEEANLKSIDIVKSGKIGEPRLFNSTFTMPVKDRGIRLRPTKQGGGPLYDIGIYCINAARYLFRSEPVEVQAISANSGKKPFREIDEAISVLMRFPSERLATFTCSFGTADVDRYQVVGTKGDLLVENAYTFHGKKCWYLTIREKTTSKIFSSRDQFAPELIYFSDCILKNKKPEPSGQEGLADIQIIEAIFQSLQSKKPVLIRPKQKEQPVEPPQEITRPEGKEPELIEIEKPSAEEAA
jgi:glucose-fructose oxidoreductase